MILHKIYTYVHVYDFIKFIDFNIRTTDNKKKERLKHEIFIGDIKIKKKKIEKFYNGTHKLLFIRFTKSHLNL